jgi:hypothetical protein
VPLEATQQGIPPRLLAEVVVNQRADGVDIIHIRSGLTLRVTAPNLLATARFAYEVIPPLPSILGAGASARGTKIRVVKTREAEVTVIGGTRGQVFVDPQLEIYEVSSITQVPPQGQQLSATGRMLTSIPASEVRESAEVENARLAIHLIPIVGTLVMIGEALVGKSIFGRELHTTERVILGAGALLAEVGALISAGKVLVAANRLSTVAGVSRMQALRLVIASRVLTPNEVVILERLATEIKAGRSLSKVDQVLANRLIGKMTEHLRVAAVRAEVEAVTGVARQLRRFTNLAKAMSKDEDSLPDTFLSYYAMVV